AARQPDEGGERQDGQRRLPEMSHVVAPDGAGFAPLPLTWRRRAEPSLNAGWRNCDRFPARKTKGPFRGLLLSLRQLAAMAIAAAIGTAVIRALAIIGAAIIAVITRRIIIGTPIIAIGGIAVGGVAVIAGIAIAERIAGAAHAEAERLRRSRRGGDDGGAGDQRGRECDFGDDLLHFCLLRPALPDDAGYPMTRLNPA